MEQKYCVPWLKKAAPFDFIMSFFKWFYCLDIPVVIALAVAVTLVFLILKERFRESRFWTPAACCLMAVWLIVVVYITVVRRESSAEQDSAWIPLYSYRLAFSGVNWELLRSNLMNVMLFYPAGLLAGSVLPNGKKRLAWILLAAFCALSLCIELSQYFFHLGLAETDDVLHNTLGAFLGVMAAKWPMRQEWEN